MNPKNKTGRKTLDKLAAQPFIEEIWHEGPDGYWADIAPGYCKEECTCLHGDNVKELIEEATLVEICPCGPEQMHGDGWFEAAEALRAKAVQK